MTGDSIIQFATMVTEARAELNEAIVVYGAGSPEADEARSYLNRTQSVAREVMSTP